MGGNIFSNTNIKETIGPIIDFLKNNGLWSILETLWSVVSQFFIMITNWLDLKWNGDLFGLLLSFFKFAINIFIVLFNILMDVFRWITGFVG